MTPSETGAHEALVLESLAEIKARLRVLDESYARLEAAVERQLELLEFLIARQERITQSHLPQNRSEPKARSMITSAQANRIIDDGHEYARETHPALFKVVDLLERYKHTRNLSVRQLAHETGVSKSWCAIAKRHVLRE